MKKYVLKHNSTDIGIIIQSDQDFPNLFGAIKITNDNLPQEILNYISTKRACVLLNSTIYCYADPQDIFKTIKEVGFEKCVECQERVCEVNV